MLANKNSKCKGILHRPNLRGLKQCKGCGDYNGMRALSCKNKQCPLSIVIVTKKELNQLKKRNLDAYQLITYNESRIYSVQERGGYNDSNNNIEKRNFVEITDKTLSSDEKSCIVSRNAICYIATCKFDSYNLNINCKHIQNAMECEKKTIPLNINYNNLYSLNLNAIKRKYLINLYNDNINRLPIVQRINKNIFIVACNVSTHFPAGLLHIFINKDIIHSLDEWFTCECTQISTLKCSIFEDNKCYHFYLIIAAIFSSSDLQKEFHLQINLLNEFYNCTTSNNNNNNNNNNNLLITDDFINFSDDILDDSYVELNSNNINNNNNNNTNSNDINNNDNNCNNNIDYDNNLLNNDSNNIITNLNQIVCEKLKHKINIEGNNDINFNNISINNSNNVEIIEIPNIKKNEVIDYFDTTMPFDNMEIINDDNNNNNTKNNNNINSITTDENYENLELIDCQIELMDQFKLTDHIDIGNDEIYLNEFIENNDDNNIIDNSKDSIMSDYLPNLLNINETEELLNLKSENQQKNILKSSDEEQHNVANQITLNKISQIPPSPPPVLVSSAEATNTNPKTIVLEKPKIKKPTKIMENKIIKMKRLKLLSDDGTKIVPLLLNFDTWLESIIEKINITMDFNDNGKPEKLIFSVYQIFFNILRTKFSIGSKLRLPNEIVKINEGKYKGLTMFIYRFSNKNLLRRIFSTDNITIEMERKFMKDSAGFYTYIDDNQYTKDLVCDSNYRKIKPVEYSTYIKVISPLTDNADKLKKNNHIFQIEWIPNVLEKSKHGEMRILFEYGHTELLNDSKLK